MPTFTYTARDQAGNQTRGTLEADTNSRAVAQLREQGLWVTDLKSSGAAFAPRTDRAESGSTLKKLFNPVPLRDLALFYRQLHTMLKSGMAIYQSLELLNGPQQTPNAQLRRVVGEIARHVLEGGRLSAVMVRYPWLFDKMQVRMIEAGETGGLLVEILERLSIYLEREYDLRLQIKRKTLYPKLLMAALIFIPPVPKLVLGGVVPYLWAVWGTIGYVLLFGLPIFLAVRFMLTTEGGRQLYDQIKLAIPVIGPLVRKMAAARFSRSLAALYGAGVPIATALAVSGESCGNFVLEQQARLMVPALERGVPISQALGGSRFFPPMFLGMVNTGETSGNLDTMLDKAADFYENESAHATMQLVVILGVVLLLIMAVLIAIQVIGAWTGYGHQIGSYTSE